jgi:hypothetical protein
MTRRPKSSPRYRRNHFECHWTHPIKVSIRVLVFNIKYTIFLRVRTMLVKNLVERCKASHVSCSCVSAFGCIACAVGCVRIEDAVCERCVLGFCVCRGRGKDQVCEAPTLRTCVDASNFLQFAFTESVILRFEQEEHESRLKLHP